MGGGSWTHDSYTSYARSTGHTTMSRDQVFRSRGLPQSLDPSKIVLRESCDSEDNPNSTPIAIALDVTGSMGFVAEHIAKHGLEKLMGGIIEQKPVRDPHLMFMGIGDVQAHDDGPLQVSQFEADIRIIEQLRDLWLEGGGGGNNFESYDLPWYFAANKTKLDCFDKRGEKGYLFTIGDELPPQRPLEQEHLRRVFGAGQHADAGSTAELLAKAQERFKVFHIVAEEGSYAQSRGKAVRAQWKELMGPNVLFMRDCKYLPEIVIATLRIANGEDVETVIAGSDCKVELAHAFDLDGAQ